MFVSSWLREGKRKGEREGGMEGKRKGRKEGGNEEVKEGRMEEGRVEGNLLLLSTTQLLKETSLYEQLH